MKEERVRKVHPILEQLEIIDAGTEGQSVAKHNGIAVFVKGAVPGDVVDVQVTRKKSNYREGKAVKFHKYSDKRTDPKCLHFGVCGGCKWQNLNYGSQLFYKQKQVFNALTRIGKIEAPIVNPIIGSERIYNYRNKLEFTFSSKRWLTEEEINDKSLTFTDGNRKALGFHIPGAFDKVLDISECHLQAEPSDKIRNEVKRYAVEKELDFFDLREQHGFLRNLIIRTASTGEVMVIVSLFEERKEEREALLDHIAAKFPEVSSLMYVINPKGNDTIFDMEVLHYKGADCIYEKMENLKFKVSPKSFYQTNPEQALKLYQVTRELAALKGDEIVYDLYTGTGTIANFVAHQAKKVIGVENVTAAIADAKINSQINGITNTAFFAGDMKDVLTDDFMNANGKPDVIITDPPRAGMHPDVVKKIMEMGAKRIVYVSCNPASQARDLLVLSEKYSISTVQPVDMFPHTAHVENVVRLDLK